MLRWRNVFRMIVPPCLRWHHLISFFERNRWTWFFRLSCFKNTLGLTLIDHRLIDFRLRPWAIKREKGFAGCVLQKAYTLFPPKKVTRAGTLWNVWVFGNTSWWWTSLRYLVSDSWIVETWTGEIVLLHSWPSHTDSKRFWTISKIWQSTLSKRIVFIFLFIVKSSRALSNNCWLRTMHRQSITRIILSWTNRLSNLARSFNSYSKWFRSACKLW